MTRPFEETDHSPGFYYGAEWQLGQRVRLTALHHDNHADPVSLRHGHYGWSTRFDHVGLQLELPAQVGMIAQWMDGRHRWSMRVDDFSVTDYDQIPLDDNSESGDAVTIAWRFEPEGSWSVGLDWVTLDVTRPAFTYLGMPAGLSEDLVNLELRYRLR